MQVPFRNRPIRLPRFHPAWKSSCNNILLNHKETYMNRYLNTLMVITAIALSLVSCGTNTNLTNNDDHDPQVLLFGTDDSFEAVTWNLRLFPLSQSSIELIAQIIPQFKVDVIAFQEIMDYGSFLQLANLIPHYNGFIYSATNTYRLAYLYDTRTVQVNQEYTIFNGETNPFPRAPYVLEITYQGRDIVLINNHLKAFGDNYIDENDPWDEEYRRRLACQKLDQYISTHFDDRKVIVLGDFNDQIAEPEEYNVFMSFLSKPEEYLFTDMSIALNPTWSTVSYPNSLSHIDHILITNELFDAFAHPESDCKTINVENWLGSWTNYYNQVSDHRPVGVKLYFEAEPGRR